MPEMTEAKKRANKKWNDENMKKVYDHAHVLFPKGRKSEIQAHAERKEKSLNAFINEAIDEKIERDNKNPSV